MRINLGQRDRETREAMRFYYRSIRRNGPHQIDRQSAREYTAFLLGHRLGLELAQKGVNRNGV